MLNTREGCIVLCLVVVAGLSAGIGFPRHASRPAAVPSARPSVTLTPAACGPDMLLDGDVCVRLPDGDDEAPDVQSTQNAHGEPRAHSWMSYEEIPRRPDRPADYDAYRYPVTCDHDCVASGYDLDRPDEAQRRGRHLNYVGHLGVDLPQAKGTPIAMVSLEHQQGDAEVVYSGPLFGVTVITRHVLREAGQLRGYLLLFGHMDPRSPPFGAGAPVKEGDTIGFVGGTASQKFVHLHLEARRVRTDVDISHLAPLAMIANENSVACDPRNVLPLRVLSH